MKITAINADFIGDKTCIKSKDVPIAPKELPGVETSDYVYNVHSEVYNGGRQRRDKAIRKGAPVLKELPKVADHKPRDKNNPTQWWVNNFRADELLQDE